MFHYVKEPQKEALKTVERFAQKKNNCLIFLSPSSFEGLLPSIILIHILSIYFFPKSGEISLKNEKT